MGNNICIDTNTILYSHMELFQLNVFKSSILTTLTLTFYVAFAVFRFGGLNCIRVKAISSSNCAKDAFDLLSTQSSLLLILLRLYVTWHKHIPTKAEIQGFAISVQYLYCDRSYVYIARYYFLCRFFKCV